MCGALCVMTPGAVQMPLWCVDNLDTLLKVRDWSNFLEDYYTKLVTIEEFFFWSVHGTMQN